MNRRLFAIPAVGIIAAALTLAACDSMAGPKPGAPRPPQGDGKTCGGIAGLQCAPGSYCRMTGPMHPDKAGVCVKKPDMCPMIYQPVCGADGKTYPNTCHAARAGTNVAHEGECKA
jgi:hypothetical protein